MKITIRYETRIYRRDDTPLRIRKYADEKVKPYLERFKQADDPTQVAFCDIHDVSFKRSNTPIHTFIDSYDGEMTVVINIRNAVSYERLQHIIAELCTITSVEENAYIVSLQ